MLDVRRMQVLAAVVASGSVTAAARELGYTPSAVSQQVAALEKEAGAALLERDGRGVRPTAAGRLLSTHAAAIGARVTEAETALADLRAGRTGRLEMRYFATAGASLVAPAVARFGAAYPGVRVALQLADPAAALTEVTAGAADLALVVAGHGAPTAGIQLEPLLDDPYLVVLPHGHPLAERRRITLAELADEPWVRGDWPGGACARIVREACERAGFVPDFVVESEDYATAQGFVAAGLGVALLPRTGLETRHPDVVVRDLARGKAPGPVRQVCVALPESDPPARAEPAVLRALVAAFAETAREVAARTDAVVRAPGA